MKKLNWFCLLVLTTMSVSCSGLDENAVKEAKKLPGQIQQVENELNTQLEGANGRLDSLDADQSLKAALLAPFQTGQEKLKECQQMHGFVQSILKSNQSTDTGALQIATSSVTKCLNELTAVEKQFDENLVLYTTIKGNPASTEAKANSLWLKIEKENANVQAKLSSLAQKYTFNQETLLGVNAKLRKISEEAQLHYNNAVSQSKSLGEINYDQIIKSLTKLNNLSLAFNQELAHVDQELSTLENSYSERLVGFQADCSFSYQLLFFDSEGGYTGTEEYGPFNFNEPDPTNCINLGIIQADLQANPSYGNEFGSNTYGFYYELPPTISSQFPNYNSKVGGFFQAASWATVLTGFTGNYTLTVEVEENGKVRIETRTVSLDEFMANTPNLDMLIVSKRAGELTSQTITVAHPPGIQYVGDTNTGSWQMQNGMEMWVWNLEYTSRYGGYDFCDHDYKSWQSNHRSNIPYYGLTRPGHKQFGTFGETVKKNQRFATARSYTQSGRLESIAKSVVQDAQTNPSSKQVITDGKKVRTIYQASQKGSLSRRFNAQRTKTTGASGTSGSTRISRPAGGNSPSRAGAGRAAGGTTTRTTPTKSK